jgi:adenylate kinase family enzyme
MCKLRVILIGGSSRIGKSTLAESLAMKLGWRHISTDSLARHPGRPWRAKPESVPLHIAEHYLSLSTNALIEQQFSL